MGPEPSTVLLVLGSARSGTTFVNKLLDEWFDYGMGPEGSFVPEFARRLSRYEPLSDVGNFRRLADDLANCTMLTIMRDKYPQDMAIDVTADMLVERAREPTYAALVRAVFESVAELQGRRHVGNKNPGYSRCLPLLDRLFGSDARYLCVLRDGRDVALSSMKMHWGEQSPYACARSWATDLEMLEAFSATVDDSQLLVVRYEDLLAEPDRELARLEGFTGVALAPERRAELLRSLLDSPMRGNFGKWRTALSATGQRQYEAVAGDWLERYGYERAVPAARLRWFEPALYSSLEFLRRVRRTIAAALRG